MAAAVKTPYRINIDDVPELHVTPPSQQAASTMSVQADRRQQDPRRSREEPARRNQS